MDTLTQEITNALQVMPSHIREVISRTPWQKKLEEISIKYSLTPEQSQTLLVEVILVLVAIVPEEELVENIKNELGVSDVLANQLTTEINERVFMWLGKLFIEKEQQHNTSQTQFIKATQNNALDIPPPNLPGEVLEEDTLTQQPSRLNPHQTEHETPSPYTPKPAPEKDSFSFKITSEQPTNPVNQQTSNQKPSFISHKLSQPTSSTSLNQDTPKTYTIDPYREPIE